MAKLRDIADATGLSVATVSKALRGVREINSDTRARVVQAASDLGYLRRSANRKPSPRENLGTVGVIGIEICSSYYARVIDALEAALRAKKYSMLLGLSRFEYGQELDLLNRFGRQEICGIICMATSEEIDYDLRKYRDKHNVPVVLLSTIIAIEDFDYVRVNDSLGARLAAQHLTEIGHSSIGYVGDALSSRRMHAFVESLAGRGIVVPDEHVRVGTERFETGGYFRMKELLEGRDPPTAVMASYDDVAIGAMRAVYEAGLSIPEDMSIVGFDGIEAAAYLARSLTTLATNTEELAAAAVRILLRKVEEPTFSMIQHIEVNPELILRESTAPPRKG